MPRMYLLPPTCLIAFINLKDLWKRINVLKLMIVNYFPPLFMSFRWLSLPPLHPMAPPNSIHWFRKGLRLHDNPALVEAVRGAGTVRCVYFLDPWFAGSSNLGVNRWRWVQHVKEKPCSHKRHFGDDVHYRSLLFNVFISVPWSYLHE